MTHLCPCKDSDSLALAIGGKPVPMQQLTSTNQTGHNLWGQFDKLPMTDQKFSPSIYWIFGNRLLAVHTYSTLCTETVSRQPLKLQWPESLENCAVYRQLVDCCLQIVDRLSLSASKRAAQPRQPKICSGLGPGPKTSATGQSHETRVAKCKFLLGSKLSNVIFYSEQNFQM